MAAGLEIEIERGAAGALARVVEGDDFRVLHAVVGVEAPSDDVTVVDNDRTDAGVR
jgi:hypothetical protein